jgi:DtxR family Mn-dependent transcriptional regulator
MGDSPQQSALRISQVMREYLAQIYRVASYQPDEDWVSTSALAERMNVSSPAVARMVGRLQARGLLEHERYRGMRLTPAGKREAMATLRQHRLTETFLVKVMGFGWREVHDEADTLGPFVSERVATRMSELSGNPPRCPHGEPIPTADGRMPVVVDEVLTAFVPPATLVISRVNTDDPDKLLYLESLGLTPGRGFELVSRAPFEGPLRLTIDGQEQVIGVELAGKLRVCAPAEFTIRAYEPA